MSLYIPDPAEQNQRVKGGRIISSFIINLALLLILFYLYLWYFEPTKPLSRLPYCVRELFFEPLSETNGNDGIISGMFVTDFIDTRHFGDAYGILRFHEDGTVAEYGANEIRGKFVRAHQLANWMEWYEKPSVSTDDIPVFAEPGKGRTVKIYRGFSVSPPTKGTYAIQQGNLTIKWNKEQKWSNDLIDELWTGTLIGEQLNMTKFHTYGTFEQTYYFINYNTCPYH